jgi:hypothetical protein
MIARTFGAPTSVPAGNRRDRSKVSRPGQLAARHDDVHHWL